MGYSNYTHIGIFLLIKETEVEIKEEKVTYETSEGEIFSKSTAFSPNTGLEIKKVVKQNIVTKKISDLYDTFKHLNIDGDEYMDSFNIPEFVSHPQGYKIVLPERFGGIDEDQFEILDDVNVSKLKRDFGSENSDFLEILNKVFDDVKIHYGVVNYTS